MGGRYNRVRKTSGGVSKIRRDTYYTQNGEYKSGLWWELRKAALARNDGMCEHPGCIEKAVEVHHIVPLSRGGRNILTNLMCLCPYHHDVRHHHMYRGR
jgi:5-methylcytosine-specific restriction endonuclease McrA